MEMGTRDFVGNSEHLLIDSERQRQSGITATGANWKGIFF